MFLGKRIGVIIIAYNAERTIEATLKELPVELVDYTIVCDDGSVDRTREIALSLGVDTFSHGENRGAGANTIQGFDVMLRRSDIDIVVLLHGDNQYDPSKVPEMIKPIAQGRCDMVLGGRVGWKKGGMPVYKQMGNSLLTGIQNLIFSQTLSDYATGYKACSRRVLQNVNYRQNKSNFEFDPQFNAQVFMLGFSVANVSVPTRYFPEASSVSFFKSVLYGWQTLKAASAYALHRLGIRTSYSVKLFARVDN
jgi:glycosyltransferase involved in cell wall biosynthesis